MGQNHVGGLTVVLVFEVSCSGLVGQVTNARKYPLLDRPWIGSVPQHFQVVVGLQQQEVDAFELLFDVGRNVPQIGGQGQAHAFGAEDESDRVGGVMGDGEGAHR